MLRRLEADPNLSGDARVARIRGNMVEKDIVALNTGVEEFLLALLEKNPCNRMAFDLLMAHYLVIVRPEGVVAWLPRVEEFSYTRIPRHFQEAAAVYALNARKPPPAAEYALDAAVLERTSTFRRIVSDARSREEAAKLARAGGFADSYFFYVAFGPHGS
jgi:hypothetical protein